jgi:hypothetical protein
MDVRSGRSAVGLRLRYLSRRVVGWAMAVHRAELVIDAVYMAI